MLKIVLDGAPSLREASKEVELPLSAKDQETMKAMLDYLIKSQDPEFLKKHPNVRSGVGLAAPQIGINKRMLVVYFLDDPESNHYTTYVLANPRIVASSVKQSYLEGGEGCLSVPKPHEGYVYRHYKVTVSAVDGLTGNPILIKERGFGAIVLQHEIDHLDGILFYDRIDKNDPFKKLPGAVSI